MITELWSFMMKLLQLSVFIMGHATRFIRVKPDLTAFGKIVGGGLPIGGYGGRQDIMEHVAPLGPAYQAGTMAGNPLSMSRNCFTRSFRTRWCL